MARPLILRQNSRLARQAESFGRPLIASIASSLSHGRVNNVLWGDSLLDIYGVPTVIHDVSFIVAAAQLLRACAILSAEGLHQCDDVRCRLANTGNSITSSLGNPSAHYHLPNSEDQIAVQLHLKETRFWEASGFDISPDFVDGHKGGIILANDSSLPDNTNQSHIGGGRYSTTLPDVRVPTPHRFVEALVLLLVRDRGTDAATYWNSSILYMVQYALTQGTLQKEFLEKPFRDYIQSQATLDVPYRQALDRAQEALGDRAKKGIFF